MTEHGQGFGPEAGRTIAIDIQAAVQPALEAAMATGGAVAIALDAVKARDYSSPLFLQSNGINYLFGFNNIPADKMHIVHAHWFLTHGIQDLTRGVFETLKNVHVVAQSLKMQGQVLSNEQVSEYMAKARLEAATLPFPALLNAVRQAMPATLTTLADLQTMQNVRNCLEHRSGVVGDTDVKNGPLTLRWFHMKVRARVAGEMIETPPGWVAPEGGAEVWFDSVTSEKAWSLGQRVSLTSTEFADLAMSCVHVANSLSQALELMVPAHPPARPA